MMNKHSISVLKQLFEAGELSEELIANLRSDERKGVQQLIASYEKKQQKNKELQEKFLQMSSYEQNCFAKGMEYIAGVDEAGRGPLAGPVVAASVILPANFELLGLNDSKQLTESARNRFYQTIKENAISYGISIVSSETIDQVNIYEAAKLAMRDAIKQLRPSPEHVLIDAVELDKLSCPSESIIKGDAKSISIAAASILAKVTRDHYMKALHSEYPMYDFASNMGYGTKQHMENIKKYGVCPYHRRSFAPVKHVVS
ncbi:ribonuclease HII [Virgibacillus kapii]|uniref:Ribonuclease HII n=2 Tax=Virgibacillus kapii TaxID=1638645 RepID=A0ABQ2D2Y1_9BACI|nr:ribonuclease HII [Virgibacillus kapii]GGJ43896.1 ribonuclease HII [Virgibacillus kapii]